MKSWNSAFSAQGSRVIIVGLCTSGSSENICSSSGGARKKESQDEIQFPTKIGGKTSLGPSCFAF